MCQQLEILEKIREKGKVNGYDIDLAEAQAKDYVLMNKKVGKIEKDVALIKKDNRRIFEMLAKQGGQIDLIVQRMNSPVEDERLQGAYWRALSTVMKSKIFWVVLAIIFFLIAMTGSEVKYILGWAPSVIG